MPPQALHDSARVTSTDVYFDVLFIYFCLNEIIFAVKDTTPVIFVNIFVICVLRININIYVEIDFNE